MAVCPKWTIFALVMKTRQELTEVLDFIAEYATYLLGSGVHTSRVMPCSVAVFTIGLMLAFSERINIVLAMFLCHWALIGLSKVYFFGIPEDYLLACSIVPALYIFFREYIRSNEGRPTKPSPRVLNALLVVLCIIIGASFAFTMLHQLNLFTDV